MNLTELTIADAAAGLRRRDYSAVELVRAHTDGIAALNPRLTPISPSRPMRRWRRRPARTQRSPATRPVR